MGLMAIDKATMKMNRFSWILLHNQQGKELKKDDGENWKSITWTTSLIDQSLKHPLNPPNSSLIDQTNDSRGSQSTNQLNIESINQTISRTSNQSINQSTDKSIRSMIVALRYSTNQSVDRLSKTSSELANLPVITKAVEFHSHLMLELRWITWTNRNYTTIT